MNVTGEMIAAKARGLLTKSTIPYVPGGEGVRGMDCQGLVRWVLKELGLDPPAKKGTNYMWRNCLAEKGSLSDCVIRWGKVPLGALVFIRAFDGGEKEHGYNDTQGNIWHVYIKHEEGGLIHASYGNGQVVVRGFADEEVPNGGPNTYGLWPGVVYTGARIPSDMADAPEPENGGSVVEEAPTMVAPVGGQVYVRVQTANGLGVNVREKASPTAIYKYTAPDGTVLLVLGSKGNYYKVHYLGKARYVDKRFVVPHEMR